MTVHANEWRLGHRLWIEGPEVFRRLHWAVRMFTLSVVLYLLGAALATLLGIGVPYLQSWAFVLGAGGCGFVAVAIAQRAGRVDELYFELSTTFDIPRIVFLGAVAQRFERACRPIGHVVVALLIWAALIVATIYSVFVFPDVPPDSRLAALRPAGFAPGLYEPNSRWATFIIVVLFAAAIALVLGTAVFVVVNAIALLGYLRRLPVPPLAESVRMRLRGLADLHLHVSRDWTIGVLLFALLFGTFIDTLSIAILSTIAVVALTLFFLPQAFLREVIIRAHRRATEITLAEWRRVEAAGSNKDAGEMAAMTELSAPPRYWVYGSSEFSLWLLAQGVAVLALVIQIVRPGST